MTDWILWGGWHPEGAGVRVYAFKAREYNASAPEMERLMRHAVSQGPGWYETGPVASPRVGVVAVAAH